MGMVQDVIDAVPPARVAVGRDQTVNAPVAAVMKAVVLVVMSVCAEGLRPPPLVNCDVASGTKNVLPLTRRLFDTVPVFHTTRMPTPWAYDGAVADPTSVPPGPPVHAPVRSPVVESICSPPVGKMNVSAGGNMLDMFVSQFFTAVVRLAPEPVV